MKINKITISIICAAMLSFVGILSETALNVSFVIIMKQFNITSSSVQWLTSGYFLVVAILIPISPILIKKIKTTRLFIFCVSIMILGTLICGLAQSFPVLLAGRLIQAISTGTSMPLMFNLILELIPKHKRGLMLGVAGMVISFSPAIGPTYGGIITSLLGWPYIFIIQIPVLFIILILGYKTMSCINTNDAFKIDFISIALSALSLTSIISSISFSSSLGWSNPYILSLFIFGMIMLSIFIKRQTTIDNPLLNLICFKYPMFRLAVILTCVVMFIELAYSFLLPYVSANILEVSTSIAGLIMLPAATINALIAPLSGKWYDKNGAKKIVILGASIAVVATSLFLIYSHNLTILNMVLIFALLLTGIPLIFTPAQTHGLNQIPIQYNADGSAIINTLCQVAGALGTAFVANILSQENPIINNVTQSFIMVIVIALIGLAASLFIKDKQKSNR